MKELGNAKLPWESRGVVGGMLATVSFSALAWVLSTIGIPVTGSELDAIRDDAGTVWLNVEAFREGTLPALMALGAAVVAMLGNWLRVARVAWTDYRKVPVTIRPWKSTGVVGGTMGVLAGGTAVVKALIAAVVTDAETARQLVEQGQLIAVDVKAFIAATAPAVTGLVGSVMLIVGRWQATRKVALRAVPVT